MFDRVLISPLQSLILLLLAICLPNLIDIFYHVLSNKLLYIWSRLLYIWSSCCTYGPDCKFQHRNNIETKNNQQPNGNIHFNITHRTSNTEIQNSKNLLTNQTIGQQGHAVKAIEDQIIQTLNQKALTEIIQVAIKEYLHHSQVAVKQQEEVKKMEQENYPKIN